MESSRRDLSNDMAEHRPILKYNQNTYYPRFSFTLKTCIAFPKTSFLFLLWYVIVLTAALRCSAFIHLFLKYQQLSFKVHENNIQAKNIR